MQVSSTGVPYAEIGLSDPSLLRKLKPGSEESVLTHYFLILAGELEMSGVDSTDNPVGRAKARLAIGTYLGL